MTGINHWTLLPRKTRLATATDIINQATTVMRVEWLTPFQARVEGAIDGSVLIVCWTFRLVSENGQRMIRGPWTTLQLTHDSGIGIRSFTSLSVSVSPFSIGSDGFKF